MRFLFRTFLLLFILPLPTAFGAKFYVKPTGTGTGSSWTLAAGNLKQILDSAQYGDEIWVAAGTYFPSSVNDRDVSFILKSGVKVYGGFSGTETLLSQRDSTGANNTTILSGELQGDTDPFNNTYIVLYSHYPDSTTVLDGLTVTKGCAYHGNLVIGVCGGGIFLFGGSPTFKNLIISYNLASSDGGGMYLINASPKIFRVKFNNNVAGGGGGLAGVEGSFYGPGSLYPYFRDVLFTNNFSGSLGGGLNLNHGSMKGVNMIFDSNSSRMGTGGLSLQYDISINIDGLTVTNNYCTDTVQTYAGGMFLNAFGTIANALIANNTGRQGGGINMFGSNVKITNATFAGNKVVGNMIENTGADVHLQSNGRAVFENCIFDSVANGKPSFGKYYAYNPPPVILKNCMLRGSLSALTTDSGGNILLTNPGFVNPAAGNYRLAACSPALNAGNNAFVSGIATDLANNPRIYANGIVDLGAYERQSGPGYAAILTPPKDTTVPAGSSATFTATGAGTTYQFQQSVNGGTTWNTISAPSSVGTITLSNVLLSMNGYQYRAIIKDPCNYADTSAVAKLFVTNSASVHAINQEESIVAVYPNPANAQLNLKSTQKGTFTLYNLLGELQRSQVIAAGISESTLNIGNLPAGVYLWRFHAEGGTSEMGKLLIQK